MSFAGLTLDPLLAGVLKNGAPVTHTKGLRTMTERNDNSNSAMEDALRAIDKFWQQSEQECGLTHAEWFEGMCTRLETLYDIKILKD